MFEKYKHIIWDWNGTLFDDVNFSVELINGLLAKYGLETISREHYSEIFQFPVKNYYAAAGFDFEKVYVIAFLAYDDSLQEQWYDSNRFCEP